jgi:hypothetical protein
MSPPGLAPSASNGITGTRNHKAETNRVLTGTIKRLCRAAAIDPQPWQVRSLSATLAASHELPTEGDVMRSLMAAPWFPKPRIRRFRVGETGWRTRS